MGSMKVPGHIVWWWGDNYYFYFMPVKVHIAGIPISELQDLPWLTQSLGGSFHQEVTSNRYFLIKKRGLPMFPKMDGLPPFSATSCFCTFSSTVLPFHQRHHPKDPKGQFPRTLDPLRGRLRRCRSQRPKSKRRRSCDGCRQHRKIYRMIQRRNGGWWLFSWKDLIVHDKAWPCMTHCLVPCKERNNNNESSWIVEPLKILGKTDWVCVMLWFKQHPGWQKCLHTGLSTCLYKIEAVDFKSRWVSCQRSWWWYCLEPKNSQNH